MRLARKPDLLEIVFGSLPHFESIHRDEHARTPKPALGRARFSSGACLFLACLTQFHMSGVKKALATRRRIGELSPRPLVRRTSHEQGHHRKGTPPGAPHDPD